MTVRNRSDAAATDVRLAVAVRQAGLRPGTGALTVTGGACARSPSAGICQVGQIEPGGSVVLRARARSRELAAPVRLVVGTRAAEPEQALANNLARASGAGHRRAAVPDLGRGGSTGTGVLLANRVG